jgi:hypothetical protein
LKKQASIKIRSGKCIYCPIIFKILIKIQFRPYRNGNIIYAQIIKICFLNFSNGGAEIVPIRVRQHERSSGE